MPLPTLLPFSLLPSPQPPLPGQCSQEAQETEEEEQSLDSRLQVATRTSCRALTALRESGRQAAATRWAPQPRPPALPGGLRSLVFQAPPLPGWTPRARLPTPAICPPSSCRRGGTQGLRVGVWASAGRPRTLTSLQREPQGDVLGAQGVLSAAGELPFVSPRASPWQLQHLRVGVGRRGAEGQAPGPS